MKNVKSRPTEHGYYPASLFDALARIVPSNGLAVDCATGTGQTVPYLAERFDSVFAFDREERYLRYAPRYPQVHYGCARAETICVASGSADLVCAAQALHQFSIVDFFQEAGRILKPGGVLACWCFGRYQIGGKIEAFLTDFEQLVSPYWERERKHVSRGYRDIAPPFPNIDIGAHRVRVKWGRREFSNYLQSWTATRKFKKAYGINPVPEIPAKLWGGKYRKRYIQWPLHVLVIQKNAPPRRPL